MSERRLHPLSPFLDLARIGPQLLVVLVLGGISQLVLLPAILLFAGVVVGWRYLLWQRFSYAVADGSLVVESGLLNRSRRVVPLDRVQQVDVQRKIRHQATGLAVVRIDTAGGGPTAEVVLDAVGLDEAERIRAVLRRDRSSVPSGGALDPVEHDRAVESTDFDVPLVVDDEPERVVVEVGVRRLAVAGITGSKLLMVFVVLGSLFGFVEELRAGAAIDAVGDVIRGESRPGALLTGALVVCAVAVWLAVAAGAAILADGGFRLTRRGDHLRVRRGLLDQREASLLVHRVQIVRVADNPLRRALGMVTVSLQSAGGSGPVDGSDTRVTVPLLSRTELDAVLSEVLPQAPTVPVLAPAPAAARRRAWVRHMVPGLVVAVPVAVVGWPVGLLALLVPVLLLGLGELAYRGLGWAQVDGHVVSRHGTLARETAVVPVAKAQSTRLASSPLQRRAGLATLHIAVAGRGRTPALRDADSEELGRLRHDALGTSAARLDERAVRARAAERIRDAVP